MIFNVPGHIEMIRNGLSKGDALARIDPNEKRYPVELYISKEDALAEGGYTPTSFEGLFRELNFKWDGWSRWVFRFHAIEVQK